ncbi:MAG TPA: glycosyltransferase, partial [Acidobacteriaceae bacterium]|nr:glycosyltransferase [Acidobacteriaceae bacterium]
FLTPGKEVLLPTTPQEVAEILTRTSNSDRQTLGGRARARILSQHTAAHRAAQFEQIVATSR